MNTTDRQFLHLAASIAGESHTRKLMKIWNAYGIHPARFYQRVNVLLDDPAAYAAMPMEVARLRRIRERHRANRQEG